ncbi:hypothetical protein TGPRC2_265420 [Toxoplasma gondii TgCatPRC2]|uniref:At4g15545-like C-terminal domain-containing protein n=17 Tax=Toxoplasma gondii TaxID=5811 RepID=B9Q1E6_TOXGV|nr:hypothetical protein TGME49_265420 [Toxoplasma gondii ME49]EPR57377.1 hypothetical protein TGGT1_265420 [Toxoplasma gondii GT1]ESS33667.1 hypothetical protein TGVEG_265420 [Toxoplasma gondii VEG]KAF4644214.1 hypothetical protein TGRH88_012060 [Toxoplasma gondii]KFG32782.1 hypothetical protein TGP89_265420 [Toxoplasma gondii p89]KFG38553.1 hypothetical protein TGDOM2_265420 [Toxoplasma gondii GAB2-2007-GAL-DOM2]KFG42110.1 hypothetical protein TGFOU_265420 [Toxoplasma gondii FOU]KFG58320.1 |eukprot:XP_002368671.1 hypothetical protein TGME49_265420 [Toxoplasma gondii ME49]
MASTTASSSGTDLSWLPSDAEEQLALGFRIVSNAYKTRVHTQEAEIRSLKAQVAEKNEQYGALQKKHSSLEVQLIESTQRGNQLAEENRQLVATIKKLHRDILRLESLKKAVLNSIQEDHSDAEESSHKYYAPEDMLQTAAPRTMSEINGVEDMGTAFLSKLSSAEGPFLTAPSSSTGAVLTPNTGDSKPVDGKVFFRNARSRMSYENFNLFLANIKKLNSHQQDREETLRNAQRLFGEANRDLFEEFKVMINRHP